MTDSSMVEVDGWTNLPPDLLNMIAKRIYCYNDYVRFRHVCKPWHTFLPNAPNFGNPWLVLPFADTDTFNIDGLEEDEINRLNPWLLLPDFYAIDETFTSSSGLHEKQIYHIRLPQLKDNIFRGSCHGFLIILMMSDGAFQMLNPFTKSCYHLPQISTFPNIVAYNPDDEGEEYTELNIKDGSISTVGKSYLHKIQLRKIITSSPPNCDDFMAVAIYGQYLRLAFCRLGDDRWTDIEHEEKTRCAFHDVIFHDGKIYAVDGKLDPGLHEFDMKDGVPLRGFNKAITPPPIFSRFSCYTHKYLVSCPNGGGLGMVVRNFSETRHHQAKSKLFYWTNKFDLYILDNENEKPIWSRLNSLRSYSLILGYNSSILMLADTFSYVRGNEVYYSDHQFENHSLKAYGIQDLVELVGGHDIGVFDLENGINNRLFPNSNLLYPPPVWLVVADIP